MRLTSFTILGILLATTAAASSGIFVTDPAGDEALEGFQAEMGEPRPCHDAAIDLRSLEVESDGETVRVAVEVYDLGSTQATCEAAFFTAHIGRTVHQRSVSISVPCVESVCIDSTASMAFLADHDEATGEDVLCAGGIVLADGTRSETCVGSGTLEGDRVVWTAPLYGTFLAENGDTREFDMRGLTVEARVFTDGQYGLIVDEERSGSLFAMSDFLFGQRPVMTL